MPTILGRSCGPSCLWLSVADLSRVVLPVLPDLCDSFPDTVSVCTPGLQNYGALEAFGGAISTVKCHEDNSMVARQVETAGRGRVLVVDGGGSVRCGLFGDNLADKARTNGWVGVIIYGCVRDLDALRRIPLGIQALAAHPLKSIKCGQGLVDKPVFFLGAPFIPGEYVYADNNGVLTSPQRLLD